LPAAGRQKIEKQFVVTLNKATPLIAFAGQIADRIPDREGRIRCLLASFPDLNDASAVSLIKCLKEQRDKYRALGSRDQPRVDRIVNVPPPASSTSCPKLHQAPAFTAKEVKEVVKQVTDECKNAFQKAINADAAVYMYVERCASINHFAPVYSSSRISLSVVCWFILPRGTKSNGEIRTEHAVQKAITNSMNENLSQTLKSVGFAVPTVAGLASRTRRAI